MDEDLEREWRLDGWPCKACGHARRLHQEITPGIDVCIVLDDQLRDCDCRFYIFNRSATMPRHQET